MEIQIDPHTIERAWERGVKETEIRETIRAGQDIYAKYDKLGKAKVYPFNKNRLGKFYKHKRVEVFYIVENKKIITVTVYAFYGEWEEKK